MRGKEKMHKVMGEFKRGTLKSSSGEKVTSHDQAVAIAMSESGMSRKGRSHMPKGAKQSPSGDIGMYRSEEAKKVVPIKGGGPVYKSPFKKGGGY